MCRTSEQELGKEGVDKDINKDHRQASRVLPPCETIERFFMRASVSQRGVKSSKKLLLFVLFYFSPIIHEVVTPGSCGLWSKTTIGMFEVVIYLWGSGSLENVPETKFNDEVVTKLKFCCHPPPLSPFISEIFGIFLTSRARYFWKAIRDM